MSSSASLSSLRWFGDLPHFLHRTHRNAAFLSLPASPRNFRGAAMKLPGTYPMLSVSRSTVRKSYSASIADGRGAFVQDLGEEVVEKEPVYEGVEAAFLCRIIQLEHKLMHVEPQVMGASLEVLSNRMTADDLKQLCQQLCRSKKVLVELCSQAGELKQMLLAVLEDPHEIRRICVMGSNWAIQRGSNMEKQIAEVTEEEVEIEILLKKYLRRCEYFHGRAARLLDSAKKLEDSIAVNSSSRRLEVSEVKLFLLVGALCFAAAAFSAVILWMNPEDLPWVIFINMIGMLIGRFAAFVAVNYF